MVSPSNPYGRWLSWLRGSPGIAPGSKTGDYTIEQVLPPDDSDNQYEIGCLADGQRRVVHEREFAEHAPTGELVETNRSVSR